MGLFSCKEMKNVHKQLCMLSSYIIFIYTFLYWRELSSCKSSKYNHSGIDCYVFLYIKETKSIISYLVWKYFFRARFKAIGKVPYFFFRKSYFSAYSSILFVYIFGIVSALHREKQIPADLFVEYTLYTEINFFTETNFISHKFQVFFS